MRPAGDTTRTGARRRTPGVRTCRPIALPLRLTHHADPRADPPVARAAVLAGWMQRNARDGQLMAHRSPGCKGCDNTGFKGRAGIHELMVVSREVRRLVQTGARAEALQHTALAEGMRTLRQDGIDKVLAGVTSIEEVRATSNV